MLCSPVSDRLAYHIVDSFTLNCRLGGETVQKEIILCSKWAWHSLEIQVYYRWEWVRVYAVYVYGLHVCNYSYVLSLPLLILPLSNSVLAVMIFTFFEEIIVSDLLLFLCFHVKHNQNTMSVRSSIHHPYVPLLLCSMTVVVAGLLLLLLWKAW